MALRYIDKVYFEHLKSLDIDERLHKYKSYQFLSYRMFKYYHYAHQTNVGTSTEDFSERSMLTAYILGKLDIERRVKSKFVVADTMLESDIMFYNAMWDIIVSMGSEHKLKPLMPCSISELENNDYEYTVSELYEDLNSYITYCQLNSIEHKTLKEICSTFLVDKKRPWQEQGRLYNKCLTRVIWRFLENAQDGTPEPYQGFWRALANKAWLARQRLYLKELKDGLVFRSNYTNGHRLYQQYFKDL